MSEYTEHVRCISTSSLDSNSTSEHATDIGKTSDKYCKTICPIRRIKCFGILIGLWNEWPENRGLMPDGSHELYLCLFVNTELGPHSALVQWTSGFYSGVKQSNHSISNSHPVSSRRYKTLHSDRQRSRNLLWKNFKHILVADRMYQMKAIILGFAFCLRQGMLYYPFLVLRTGRCDFRILIGARSVPFTNCPDLFWRPLFLLFNKYRCYFSAVEPPRHDVHHSLPTSAEIENV